MNLIELSTKRNEMQKQQRSIIGDMEIPYSLAKEWIETERAYQIHLTNIEASKLGKIIKEQAEIIKDLRRGVKA